MKVTAINNKGAVPPPPSLGEEYRPDVPLIALCESPLNPRKHYDQHKLDELAASIRKSGIITPFITRRVADGLEILAGHRRRRAAMQAGLKTVPVRILDMDDATALEVLTIENDQREDVHPLEQADGYRELIKRNGYDLTTLADKIGRPEAFITGRLQLCDLVPVVRESFLHNSITIGHARLLSRVPSAKQEEALGMCFHEDWQTKRAELISVQRFRQILEREMGGADLSRAPFDLYDKTLKSDAGPCTQCPKCSGAQRSLLGDESQQLCLDDACYSQKLNAHIQRQKAAGFVAISTKYDGKIDGVLSNDQYIEIDVDQADIAELESEVADFTAQLAENPDCKMTAQNLEQAKLDLAETVNPAKCEFEELAVVVESHGDVGITKRICRNKDCQIHGGDLNRQGGRGSGYTREAPTFAEIWKEKRKRVTDQIEIDTRREITRLIYHECPGKPDPTTLRAVADRLMERIGHDISAELVTILDLPTAKAKYGGRDVYAPIKKLVNAAANEEQLWKSIMLMTVACATSGYGGNKELSALAKYFEIDEKAVSMRVGATRLEKFEKAKANAAKKGKEDKQGAKPVKATKGKKAAAGDEGDD